MSERTSPRLPDGVALTAVPWDDEHAGQLRAEQQAELLERYGEPDIEPHLPTQEMVATVLVSRDGEVAGCGSLRAYGPGRGELKRMYVRPGVRGQGLGRLVLAELERLAAAHGISRLLLETGVRQPEAIRLYRSAGYRRVPNYGPYLGVSSSVCYGRSLDPAARTHVLVVNGTMGAGKTTIASAIADLLREDGTAHAWVDVDALCQAWPRPPEDPYAQDLAFAGLAGLAPALTAQGYRHVVLARVVEDAADRERYEQAFDGADVTIVRLDAREPTRVARLVEREPAGYWQDLALARTVELESNLRRLDLDDAVIDNDERAARRVAQDVLRVAGWTLETRTATA